ncbi:MAG: hypothetical protein ABIR70_12890 [Bryobacteraceae bacterium]
MPGTVTLKDGYYAAQSHGEAPWLIRDHEHRVVGHYTVAAGISWGGAMREADKQWLAHLIQQTLAQQK